MAKILVIGEVLFESQFFVDSLPSLNEVATASDADNIIGSKTINTGRVLEKLNNDVYFFGRVGDDLFGETAKRILENDFHFFPDFLATVPDSKTGKVIVLTDKSGQSAISIYFGANTVLNYQDINSVKNSLEEFDLVYSATSLPMHVLYLLVDECKKQGVPIFLDVPNQHKLIDLTKVNNASFIAPNRQEAGLLLDMQINTIEDAKKACIKMRKKYEGNIIITLDKDGCILFDKGANEPIHYPTIQVDTVDETGSGDIFRGVFVSEYLKTNNIEQSIKLSLKIASESVKFKGVDNTIKSLDYNL